MRDRYSLTMGPRVFTEKKEEKVPIDSIYQKLLKEDTTLSLPDHANRKEDLFNHIKQLKLPNRELLSLWKKILFTKNSQLSRFFYHPRGSTKCTTESGMLAKIIKDALLLNIKTTDSISKEILDEYASNNKKGKEAVFEAITTLSDIRQRIEIWNSIIECNGPIYPELADFFWKQRGIIPTSINSKMLRKISEELKKDREKLLPQKAGPEESKAKEKNQAGLGWRKPALLLQLYSHDKDQETVDDWVNPFMAKALKEGNVLPLTICCGTYPDMDPDQEELYREVMKCSLKYVYVTGTKQLEILKIYNLSDSDSVVITKDPLVMAEAIALGFSRRLPPKNIDKINVNEYLFPTGRVNTKIAPSAKDEKTTQRFTEILKSVETVENLKSQGDTEAFKGLSAHYKKLYDETGHLFFYREHLTNEIKAEQKTRVAPNLANNHDWLAKVLEAGTMVMASEDFPASINKEKILKHFEEYKFPKGEHDRVKVWHKILFDESSQLNQFFVGTDHPNFESGILTLVLKAALKSDILANQAISPKLRDLCSTLNSGKTLIEKAISEYAEEPEKMLKKEKTKGEHVSSHSFLSKKNDNNEVELKEFRATP